MSTEGRIQHKSHCKHNLTIDTNWLDLGLLIPATLCIAALGAYLPARRAARVPAAEILRYE